MARDVAARRRAGGRPAAGARPGGADRRVFGVPERFMRPRLVLLAVVAALVGFGLLMVFSASSVTALSSTGDPAYYLKRQLGFVAAGALCALALAKLDYRLWVRQLLMPIWVLTAALLLAVIVLGTDNGMGATRWIDLGFFDLQPSEFAKITVIFTAANLAEQYYDRGSIDWIHFIVLLGVGVGLPLVLIVTQPDKGTTMVVGLTLVVMGYLAGVPKRYLLVLLALGAAVFLFLSLRDDYSRARFLTMFDPWADPYGNGWQLIQGFYAFGSGGLLGVGVGFSRQKYSYLPMAHNDFIFAVAGEEWGFVGTIGVLAGFLAFLWAGLEIARHAPDFAGRLVAAGCTSIVVIQLFLNVFGVLGLFPLSGKPIPFLSYGGSSILASLMLVGLVMSVSLHSKLPETAHDGVRRSWREVGGEPDAPALSLVGEATSRSERRAPGASPSRSTSGPRLRVVDGGRGPRGGARAARGRPGPGGGRTRIDLGPSATERLRGRDRGPGGRR
ncbi:MAG TPA: putative lipid II flippase FtsW [Candidatus Olsenella excrementigallinarum]|nr:putative lipid II flippase FtsW [Candidatus Olsenella excrementigallinarum]